MRRDPWLAVNLSWTIPGLGQFYAGHAGDGFVFLCGELLAWAGLFAFVVGWLGSVVWLAGAALGFAALRILSSLHVHHAMRDGAPGEKSPWLAFFLTRFLPGLGHAYARRWLRAAALFVAFCALATCVVCGGSAVWPEGLLLLLSVFALLDAYLVLRKDRTGSFRGAVVALIFLIPASHGRLAMEGLRMFLLESYLVPSRGMAPAIRPDDRLLVGKWTYLWSDVERFDAVAFRFPLDRSRVFLKRVVGLPGDELFFEHGDIYCREAGDLDRRFRILRKPREKQESLWVDLAGTTPFLSDEDAFRRSWETAPEETDPTAGFEVVRSRLTTFERDGAQDIRFRSTMDIEDDGSAVDDLRIALDLEIHADHGRFFVEVHNGYGRFLLLFSPSEVSHFEARLNDGTKRMPLRTRRIRSDRRYRIELEVCDGAARVLLDGGIEAELAFIGFHGDRRPRGRDPMFTFGARDLLFTLHGLCAGRDVCYRQRPVPIALPLSAEHPLLVPRDSCFVVGDNISASHDGRSWIRHSFRLKDGRTLVCEDREIARNFDERDAFRRILDLDHDPYRIIKADEDGEARWLEKEDVISHEADPFPFVPLSDVQGRVLRIWWPPGRAGRIP